jgi:beta-xylosidase
MNFPLFIFVVAALLALRPSTKAAAQPTDAATTSSSATYTNPIRLQLADPFVLKEKGIYYLYGTQQPSQGFQVHTSTDLTTWTERGYCYETTSGTSAWGKKDFWAPEVVKYDGKFWMFYVAKNTDENRRNICVAVADTPLGPFVDVKAPILPDDSYIDPHVYRDPVGGKWYIYATREKEHACEIIGAPFNMKTLDIEGTTTQCIAPSQDWERGWTEGAFMLERNGWYYMMYTGCAFWDPRYATGFAWSRSPLGPFEKYPDNPILKQTPEVPAPGHNCVIETPDGKGLAILYHRHREPGRRSRYLALEPMHFEDTGTSGPARIVLPGAPSSTPRQL